MFKDILEINKKNQYLAGKSREKHKQYTYTEIIQVK